MGTETNEIRSLPILGVRGNFLPYCTTEFTLFEPRYIKMIDRVVSQRPPRTFCWVPFEVTGDEPINSGTVGLVAHITRARKSSRRWTVVVIFTKRVRILACSLDKDIASLQYCDAVHVVDVNSVEGMSEERLQHLFENVVERISYLRALYGKDEKEFFPSVSFSLEPVEKLFPSAAAWLRAWSLWASAMVLINQGSRSQWSEVQEILFGTDVDRRFVFLSRVCKMRWSDAVQCAYDKPQYIQELENKYHLPKKKASNRQNCQDAREPLLQADN